MVYHLVQTTRKLYFRDRSTSQHLPVFSIELQHMPILSNKSFVLKWQQPNHPHSKVAEINYSKHFNFHSFTASSTITSVKSLELKFSPNASEIAGYRSLPSLTEGAVYENGIHVTTSITSCLPPLQAYVSDRCCHVYYSVENKMK